jgi:Ca-activated chloride channel family protein
MTFLSPWWLLLLVAVAALAVVYVVAQRRRSRYAVRFATLPLLEKVAPKRPGWRRHAPAAAFLLTLVALALAVARPVADVRVPRERATVLVAVDTSISMRADDVAPSRIEAAKDAADAFVDGLPKQFNVGLVSFSGAASVVVSPTTDRAAVHAGVDQLTLAERTAIGEGVLASLQAISTLDATLDGGAADGAPPARIVLLSDGENTAGRSLDAAAEAATKAGVQVSTIAYGTAEGTVAGEDGRAIRVPVNAEALASLAEATGGKAYTAATGEELAEVYDDIGSSIGWRTEQREITAWVVAGAFVLALVTAGFSLVWFARLP